MIFNRPSLTASAACLPISAQLTYHCGFISGSTMSLDRLSGSIQNRAEGMSLNTMNASKVQTIHVPHARLSLSLPADWYDHRVVFDLFKKASVHESL